MPRAERDSAFLNLPYDPDDEDHFLAYIAGVAAFGLDPRATLELTGGERRLDRIFKSIAACRYSFQDLSFVRLDRRRPPTPRFNMPFELVEDAAPWILKRTGAASVFEARPFAELVVMARRSAEKWVPGLLHPKT